MAIGSYPNTVEVAISAFDVHNWQQNTIQVDN